MTAIQKEADEIISMMRRSKMDNIREELEAIIKVSKFKDSTAQNGAANFIARFKSLFERTSNNAPLP